MSHDVIWAVRWSDLMLSDDLIRHTYVNETPLPGGAAPRVGSGSGRGSRAWCVTWPSGSRRIPHTDRPQLHTCGGPPTCSIGTARRRMIGRPASRRRGVYTHQPDNRKKKKEKEEQHRWGRVQTSSVRQLINQATEDEKKTNEEEKDKQHRWGGFKHHPWDKREQREHIYVLDGRFRHPLQVLIDEIE